MSARVGHGPHRARVEAREAVRSPHSAAQPWVCYRDKRRNQRPQNRAPDHQDGGPQHAPRRWPPRHAPGPTPDA